jgi:thiol:disulfide interchange protein DsbC
MKLIPTLLAAATLATSAWVFGVQAQEATIRKNLSERVPQLQQDRRSRPTAMQGLYEVRNGTDILYTDAEGNYLIQGSLIDTKARRNLTEERIDKLTAVDFRQPAPQGRLHHRARQRQTQAGRV